MADFEWNELYFKWFLKKFNDKTEELTAREIYNAYKPKKGEPKKVKSKEGEPILDLQDFRNLMRLMVLNEYARVTNGSFKSKNYKIRMISDKYPYIQEVFSQKLLFKHTRILEPMPDIEEIKNVWVPSSANNWTELHQQAFERYKERGYMYANAFRLYQYGGGDFDSIFLEVDGLDRESTDGTDSKNLFILHVHFFILLYKAFEIGLPELKKWFGETNSDIPCPEDCDTFFTCALTHLLVQSIFLEVEKRDRTIPHRTLSNSFGELLNFYENGMSIPQNLSKRLEKGFNPSEEVRHIIRLGYAKLEILALRSSENHKVKEAVEEVDKAFLNILSFYQTRFERSRNPKRSTNVA